MVANGRTAAGGQPVAPRANPEDGLLDVVVVRAGSALDIARLGALVLAGDYVTDDAIVFRQVSRVRIDSTPGMWFNVDGELRTNEPVDLRGRPGRAPRHRRARLRGARTRRGGRAVTSGVPLSAPMAAAPTRPPMTEEEARKRVAREKKFYAGLGSYVVVIAGLAAMNLLTSPGYLWFLWAAFGWGMGVTGEAVKLFGLPGMQGWEARRLGELPGQGVSEARLRQVLDETLDERAVPAGAPQPADRLQRRIEHLEAIVTSLDWDATASLPESPALGSAFDALADEETAAEQAARIARRVR